MQPWWQLWPRWLSQQTGAWPRRQYLHERLVSLLWLRRGRRARWSIRLRLRPRRQSGKSSIGVLKLRPAGDASTFDTASNVATTAANCARASAAGAPRRAAVAASNPR